MSSPGLVMVRLYRICVNFLFRRRGRWVFQHIWAWNWGNPRLSCIACDSVCHLWQNIRHQSRSCRTMNPNRSNPPDSHRFSSCTLLWVFLAWFARESVGQVCWHPRPRLLRSQQSQDRMQILAVDLAWDTRQESVPPLSNPP